VTRKKGFIMRKLNKLIALATAVAMLTSNLAYSQGECCDDAQAYSDGCGVSYTSLLIPVGVIVVAAIIIAATDNHHHHHSSSSSSHSH